MFLSQKDIIFTQFLTVVDLFTQVIISQLTDGQSKVKVKLSRLFFLAKIKLSFLASLQYALKMYVHFFLIFICQLSNVDICLYHQFIMIRGCADIATTQPTTQNNLKQFCWGGIIIG